MLLKPATSGRRHALREFFYDATLPRLPDYAEAAGKTAGRGGLG
jgi:hypothetical protein